MNSMRFKRLIVLAIILAISLALLLFRLIYVQIIAAESFSKPRVNLIKQAVSQRQQQLILDSGRGEITDRHGHVLTSDTAYVAVLFPLSNRALLPEKLQQLAQLLSVPVQELREVIQQLREPQIFTVDGRIKYLTEGEAEQINQLQIEGILGLPYEQRYAADQRLASHLLGTIGENPELVRRVWSDEADQGKLTERSEVGITGLERTFQPFLQGTGPASLAYYVDGRGDPLHGLGIKYIGQENPFYPLSLETTLDAELQMLVEGVLAEEGVREGAVVILDAATSEILASASRPSAKRDQPDHPSWRDKVLSRYAPGSIFKIVVAAAALEENLATPATSFECNGQAEGTNFHCWLKEGHGSLTLAEAFYHSCNLVFGELAVQLGPHKLEEYARKLGLLDQNGWHAERLYHLLDFRQLDREETGQLFAPQRNQAERHDRRYLLSTAIGQMDVQLTPLSVANMLATITRGGAKYQVKAVNRINYHTGGTFYRFAPQRLEGPTISTFTAYQLQSLLAGVVKEGTARSLKDHAWPVAGKTGTAQTGNRALDMPSSLNHHWFAGYFPADQPRYVMVVLALNQPEKTENKALKLFDRILEQIILNTEAAD